jgi:hypothetical protein
VRDAAYRRISAVRATRKTLVVPTFAYAATWGFASHMLAMYSIGNVNPFTFKRPIVQPTETFVAAVSWSEPPYVFRYKLADLGVLYFPIYNGEQIGANAYFEIWNVSGSSVAYIEEDWTLTCSKLILPDLCQCITNTESATASFLEVSVLPTYQFCNPFCSPLCGPAVAGTMPTPVPIPTPSIPEGLGFVRVISGAPSGVPTSGERFVMDSTTGKGYFWNGFTWINIF